MTSGMMRLRRITSWFAAALVAFGVLGAFVLPPLAKSMLTQRLGELLHREVTIQGLTVNPYALSARIKGFSVKDKGSTVASFSELYVNLSATSLWYRAPVLEEVHLTEPYLHVVRIEGQKYNFSDIIDQFLTKPAGDSTAGGESKARFSVNNVRITGGSVDFDDLPEKTKHTLRDLTVALPFVSNLPYFSDQYIEPAFSVVLNGTLFSVTGKTKPFSESLETVVTLNFLDFDLTRYIEYVPVDLRFKVKSALLDTQAFLSFVRGANDTPSVTLSGKFSLKDVAALYPTGKPLLGFSQLDVDLARADLLTGDVTLRRLSLQTPDVHVARDKAGQIDLLALAPAQKAAASEPKQESKTKPVIELAEVRISDGTMHWSDESVSPSQQTDLQAINITARNISTAPGTTANIDATLHTAAKEALKATANLKLDGPQADGHIELTAFQPNSVASYLQKAVRFEIQEGALDLATDYHFAQASGTTDLVLSNLGGQITNLRLRQPGEKEDFLALPNLSVGQTELNLAKRTLAIGEVASKGAAVLVLRDAQGRLNLASLAAPAAAGPAAPPAGQEGNPWSVALHKLALEGYSVRWEDHLSSGTAKVRADDISLTAQNLSTAKGEKADAQLRATINKRGSLQADGQVALEPLAANFKVDVKSIDLIPLQPYFVDILRVQLVRGGVSTHGTLTIEAPASKPVRVGFTGDASVAPLHTVDKVNAADFLKWQSLNIRGIGFTSEPMRLHIRDIALNNFFSVLVVTPEGRLNLQDIIVRSSKQATAPTAGASAPPASPRPAAVSDRAPQYSVKINTITLKGGNVDFSDHFIKPNYSANLTGIGGTVVGLSSDPRTTARVALTGQVNNQAPLTIDGAINPLAKTLFLDLKAATKGVELSPFTPYSGKYAGYGIEKGKLSLDVSYHIENNKLTAENKLFLDQLTFGAKVDSPDATKLPVLLAVALLKDRKGNIDLNLPISGSLDDPQFSIGGLIIKVIINLLTKAITAPFALLGAMFGGGGEELSYIEFDPGKATITPTAEAKLKTLAKALGDRPGLKLDVAGRAYAGVDAEAAKRDSLDQKVRAQKLNALVKKGESVEAPEKIQVDPTEYPALLEAVYKQEKFAKPRNFIGMAKSLPTEEMEKLIIDNTKVGDEELRLLAERRARAVSQWLIQQGQIGEDRVFLVAPKLGAPEAKDQAKASRVDLSLK